MSAYKPSNELNMCDPCGLCAVMIIAHYEAIKGVEQCVDRNQLLIDSQAETASFRLPCE